MEVLAMSTPIPDRIAALLTGPTVQKIDFTFEHDPKGPGFRIEGHGYRLVAAPVRGEPPYPPDIEVKIDPTLAEVRNGKVTRGAYYPSKDLMVFPDANPPDDETCT